MSPVPLSCGDLLHLTRAASVQFAVRPIVLRLIRVREDWVTYDGWVWLDGYQVDERGDAVERRTLFVLRAGVRVLRSPPSGQVTGRPVASPGGRRVGGARASPPALARRADGDVPEDDAAVHLDHRGARGDRPA
ncbi:hypothetical protein [Micromonospora fluostatini]|uniref:hypothetical protein n=1 Tax=Micromonospora sp. JCM 30529 TaxID=3421643 RepID=UPI003D17AE62